MKYFYDDTLKTAKTIKAEPTQYDQRNKVWTNQFQFKIEMVVWI